MFKQNLGYNFTTEWFISKLESGTPITLLIQDNEMLFGILLGYGAEASQAFKEANENHKGDFAPEWTDTYCGLEAKRPNGCKIFSVEFMSNPYSPDTQRLLSVYENELQSIWNAYQKKD